MPPAPILSQGMPVEVMKDFDTVLLFGRLDAITSARLTIQRIPGKKNFQVYPIGSTVLVRGYDAWMNPVLLRGRVGGFSEVRWIVRDLERIPYKTHRENVRYPLAPPAIVCALDKKAVGKPQP